MPSSAAIGPATPTVFQVVARHTFERPPQALLPADLVDALTAPREPPATRAAPPDAPARPLVDVRV